MDETPAAAGDGEKTARPRAPRPVEVTAVSLLFILGSAGGLVVLVAVQVLGADLGVVENLGAVLGIVVHLLAGALMLRGSQWGRVTFWLGVPVLLPILAALRSFDWVIFVGLAATWIILGLLDTEAADRYFFGRLATVGEPLPANGPEGDGR